MSRPKGDQGQVLSSLVAVAAVVAIVAGLLVLFGTRGHDSEADEPSGATTPKPSTKPHVRAVDDRRQHPRAVVEADRAGHHAYAGPVVHADDRADQLDRAELAADPAAGNPVDDHPGRLSDRRSRSTTTPRARAWPTRSRAGRGRRAGPWPVADNWHGKIAESTVYYPPGMLDAANQLARDIGVGRTKGALDNMKKDRLTVILTSDYAG